MPYNMALVDREPPHGKIDWEKVLGRKPSMYRYRAKGSGATGRLVAASLLTRFNIVAPNFSVLVLGDGSEIPDNLAARSVVAEKFTLTLGQTAMMLRLLQAARVAADSDSRPYALGGGLEVCSSLVEKDVSIVVSPEGSLLGKDGFPAHLITIDSEVIGSPTYIDTMKRVITAMKQDPEEVIERGIQDQLETRIGVATGNEKRFIEVRAAVDGKEWETPNARAKEMIAQLKGAEKRKLVKSGNIIPSFVLTEGVKGERETGILEVTFHAPWLSASCNLNTGRLQMEESLDTVDRLSVHVRLIPDIRSTTTDDGLIQLRKVGASRVKEIFSHSEV